MDGPATWAAPMSIEDSSDWRPGVNARLFFSGTFFNKALTPRQADPACDISPTWREMSTMI